MTSGGEEESSEDEKVDLAHVNIFEIPMALF